MPAVITQSNSAFCWVRADYSKRGASIRLCVAFPSGQCWGGAGYQLLAANLGGLLQRFLRLSATSDELRCVLWQSGLPTALTNLPNTIGQSPCPWPLRSFPIALSCAWWEQKASHWSFGVMAILSTHSAGKSKESAGTAPWGSFSAEDGMRDLRRTGKSCLSFRTSAGVGRGDRTGWSFPRSQGNERKGLGPEKELLQNPRQIS